VIVDMREELKLGNTSPISKRLHDELLRIKDNEEQAIIFLNRRGYSSQVSCKECGEVITCPRCSVSMTYHSEKGGGKLLCHLCGYRQPVPRACTCGAEKLSFLGYGTQKLESELLKYLPEMPVMRMDADTTSGKLAYDKLLEEFREGEADILLGTQMVAKGHDFPRVTLVGVALADTSLYVSDFRASERTFSLLTQVIGRAGRAKDTGIAVIQTFQPRNETIRLACKQDYETFYEGEIAIRRELSYPPFCDMAQLTLTADNEAALGEASKRLSDMILEKLSGEYSKLPFVVYGPFEAQVYKLNEKYRMRMVVKCKLTKETRALFKLILCEFATMRDATLSIDLNPLTI
jgi:primosomal protein N' (replication factor Y)